MLIEPNLARRHALVSSRTAGGSFDHLVSTRQQSGRDAQVERFGDPEIYHQLQFGWLLHRQFPGLGATEDLVDETSGTEVEVRIAHPVSQQPAGLDELPRRIN